jgi:DNA-binding transcriptional regulator YiaG
LLTTGEHVNRAFGERRSLPVSAIIIRMEHIRAGHVLAQRASDLAGMAQRLIAARQAKGLRLTDLAVMSGLGTNTIANWEAGQRRPRIDQLAMVLPILDVTSDWVYFGDDRELAWQTREAIMREMATLGAPPPSPSRQVA